MESRRTPSTLGRKVGVALAVVFLLLAFYERSLATLAVALISLGGGFAADRLADQDDLWGK